MFVVKGQFRYFESKVTFGPQNNVPATIVILYALLHLHVDIAAQSTHFLGKMRS